MKTKISELEPGDLVFLESKNGISIEKVLRTTLTMIVLENGTRFRKIDSDFQSEIGGDVWYRKYLRIIKSQSEIDEHLLKVKKHKILNLIKNFDWNTLSLEKLEAIKSLL